VAKMRVTVSSDGDIKVQIEGVRGKKCLDLSKAFEESLGEVAERRFTSEYHLSEQNDSSQRSERRVSE